MACVEVLAVFPQAKGIDVEAAIQVRETA
jgi:hypothetical protein